MLYPRIADLNGTETLVQDNQCYGYREHLADNHRCLFLSGIIGDSVDFHDMILAMDSLSHEPIKIFIYSGGGNIDPMFLLYDTFKMIKSPIITIGRYCASAAAVLLATGSKRYLYPHAKVMLHLPAGQMGGDARDWDIQHKQMQQYKDKMVDILCECGVKKSRDEILADIDRDYWLEPHEAILYGLADEIITKDIWGGLICQP